MGSNWLQTSHGHRLNLPGFDSPDPRCISFQETAWVLSGIQRFGARTTCESYTVAEHSINVMERVADSGASPLDQFIALNHEGDEALMGFDPGSPLLRVCPDLRRLKEKAHRAYFEHYGLDPELPAVVKDADLYLLCWERRDLMAPSPHDWHMPPLALPERQLVPRYLRRYRAWDEWADHWKRLALDLEIPEERW